MLKFLTHMGEVAYKYNNEFDNCEKAFKLSLATQNTFLMLFLYGTLYCHNVIGLYIVTCI